MRLSATALIGLLLLVSTSGLAQSRSTRSVNAIADELSGSPRMSSFAPNLGPKAQAAWLRKLDSCDRRLGQVKQSRLDQQGRVSFRMLKDQIAQEREKVTGGWLSQDANGTASLMHGIVEGVAGIERGNVTGWRETIKLLRRSQRFIDSYIRLQEQGVKTGRVPPKLAVRSAIRSLEPLVSDTAGKNPFLALGPQLEKELAGNEKLPELRRELNLALRENVLPAHRKLKKFLETRALPAGTKLGADRQRYLHFMAAHLGPIHKSPEELGAWGRSEVSRLQAELWKVARQIDPGATSLDSFMSRLRRQPASHFKSGEELIAYVKQELGEAKALARKMAPVPRSTVEVTPVPKHQEATTPAQYYLSEGGEKPVGMMQVNTGPQLSGQVRYEMPTLVTHEVFGGHHLAGVYADKQKQLPDFRRSFGSTAYDEGWALYAEQWRDEHGGFTAEGRIGYLTNQLWRAARLVVDTSLHTGKMSSSQAVEYFRKAAFTSRVVARGEIARYIDWPGQALAYYVGKQQILEIRDEVKRALGKHYDERAFHAKLLSLGSVPLPEAQKVMRSWANRRKGQLAN